MKGLLQKLASLSEQEGRGQVEGPTGESLSLNTLWVLSLSASSIMYAVDALPAKKRVTLNGSLTGVKMMFK